MKLRKIVSMVLTMAMLLTMMPFAVVAQDADVTTVTDYSGLADAFANGGEITLGADISIDATLTVASGTTVVLDLNGYTVSCSIAYTTVITNNGTLTINDSSETKTGTVKAIGGVNSAALVNNVGGTVTINGGSFVGERPAATEWKNNHYVVVNHGTMTINDGAISTNGIGSALIENGWQNGDENTDAVPSVMTINGGTFEGGSYNVKVDDYGVLTVNGGTFTNNNNCNILVWNQVTITDGTFITDSIAIWGGQVGDAGVGDGLVTISGGDFTEAANAVIAYESSTCTGFNANTAVTGGTYSETSAEAYCANGFALEAVDGVYTVEAVQVAAIGETTYTSLADAFSNAKAGDTVELLSDITLTEAVAIRNNSVLGNITLDGKGYTIYDAVAETSTLVFGDTNGSYWATGVTIKDLTVKATSDNTSPYCAIRLVGGTSSTLTNVKVIGDYAYGINFYGTHGATLDNCQIASAFTNGQDAFPLNLTNGTTITTLHANSGEVTDTAKVFVDSNSTIENLICWGDSSVMIDSEAWDNIGTAKTLDAGDFVAEVNGVRYTTLAAAIADATDGNTVTLLADVEISSLIAIESDITLDLGNFAVTSTAKKAFEVYADVTIENGTINALQRCVDTREAVELTLNNVVLNVTSTSGDQQPLTVGGSENGTAVTVNNCEINAGTDGYAIIVWVDSDIEVNNTAITGWNALYVKSAAAGSEVTFSGCNIDTVNNAKGSTNSFATVVLEANDVAVNLVDTDVSASVADGCETQFVFSIGSTAALNVSGSAISVDKDSTITVDENSVILSCSGDFVDNTVTVPAAYAEALEAEGYTVSEADANGMVGVTGVVEDEDEKTIYDGLTALSPFAYAQPIVTFGEKTELYRVALMAEMDYTLYAECLTNDTCSYGFEVTVGGKTQSFEVSGLYGYVKIEGVSYLPSTDDVWAMIAEVLAFDSSYSNQTITIQAYVVRADGSTVYSAPVTTSFTAK
ncbi:MAG: hypothetical protein IJ002_04030 [Clostridia bacterium]|nr:hypothetical protein [Clostridia bacterium]